MLTEKRTIQNFIAIIKSIIKTSTIDHWKIVLKNWFKTLKKHWKERENVHTYPYQEKFAIA